MNNEALWTIFVNATLINNFVLAYFLGICPFLGVSGKIATASRMGGAVTFVMLISSLCAFGLHRLLLAVGAPYLELISFIAVIASDGSAGRDVHQEGEPGALPRPGHLPAADHDQLRDPRRSPCSRPTRATASSSAWSTLWAPARASLWRCVLMAGLREKLELAEVPDVAKGTALALVVAGLLSMAFMGFAGLGG